MKKIISKILDIIFPKRCINCSKRLDTNYIICLCNDCKDKVFTKNIEKRQFEKRFFEKIICASDYKGLPRKYFLRYKFSNLKYLHDTFAKMMYFKIKNDEDYQNIDIVTPVPLSVKRYEERGFNQSELISKVIANLMSKEHISDLLTKIKHTKAFSTLKFNERRKEVRGSYIFNDKYDIKGKNILLIDDIYTTGTTINECSKILKMYGANSVLCATIFNAVGRDEFYERKNIHDTN